MAIRRGRVRGLWRATYWSEGTVAGHCGGQAGESEGTVAGHCGG